MNKLGLIFCIIGGAFILFVGIPAYIELDFRVKAVEAEGIIVDFKNRTDNDGDTYYYPVVEYRTDEGIRYSFESDAGSRTPKYPVGEKRIVLYDPKNPSKAELAEYKDNLYIFALFVGISLIFVSIGLIMLYRYYRRQKEIVWLKNNGVLIDIDFKEVGIDNRIQVNNRSPYVIYGEWNNPQNGQRERLKSDHIWFDPRPYIRDMPKIKVWVDPSDYRRYYIDLSFLPQEKK